MCSLLPININVYGSLNVLVASRSTLLFVPYPMPRFKLCFWSMEKNEPSPIPTDAWIISGCSINLGSYNLLTSSLHTAFVFYSSLQKCIEYLDSYCCFIMFMIIYLSILIIYVYMFVCLIFSPYIKCFF